LAVRCYLTAKVEESATVASSLTPYFSFETINDVEYYDLAHLLFHRPSRSLITHGSTDLFSTPSGKQGLERLVDYRNWLWRTVPNQDQWRFMMFSSAILFAYGVRAPNDIDLYIHRTSDEEELPLELIDHLYTNIRFPWLEPSCRGLGAWVRGGAHERLYTWFLRDWPQMSGGDSMMDMVNNPSHHFYFLGLKCISLKADLVRRVSRQRPAAYADLIAITQQSRIPELLPVEIPPLPKEFWMNRKLVKLLPEDQHHFVKTTRSYLRARYGVLLSTNEVEKILHCKISPPSVRSAQWRISKKCGRVVRAVN